MPKRNNYRRRRTGRRNNYISNMVSGSTQCTPFVEYARGTTTLSSGVNTVTYTVANLFGTSLTRRVVFPTHLIVRFQPIFPTGSTPGTNIIYAQLGFRDPATLTDVPGTNVRLLSQTNSTQLRVRIPKQASAWFQASNTSIIMLLYVSPIVACSLSFEIEAHALLARDFNL